MEDQHFLWKGVPLDKFSKYELIEIIIQLNETIQNMRDVHKGDIDFILTGRRNG